MDRPQTEEGSLESSELQPSTRSLYTPNRGNPQRFDINDPVRVVIRVRPMNTTESMRRDGQAVFVQPDRQTIAAKSPDGKAVPSMTFNEVFDMAQDQEVFFDQSGVKTLIEKAIEGYNATVFAYGQTGSGKSYTITGPEDVLLNSVYETTNWGLVPRSLRHMFSQLSDLQQNSDVKVTISASYLEIYNEQVQDLLNPTSTSLPVRFNNEKGFFVENLFVVECEVLDDCIAVLEEGLRNRSVAAHKLNEHSSRSHGLLQIIIESETTDPEDMRVLKKVGKLTFVDLAGSEKLKESQATGDTMVETLNINKSLLCLGKCIQALSDLKKKKTATHVPYRDSKLTKLLADTLGGNGIALMIACVSPSSYNLNETLNTLRYASRAKKIQNKPALQVDAREQLISRLKTEVKQLRLENQTLKEMKPQSAKVQAVNNNIEVEALKEDKKGLEQTIRKMDLQNKELLEENDRLISKMEKLVQVFGSELQDPRHTRIPSDTKEAPIKGKSKNSEVGGGNARLTLMAKHERDQSSYYDKKRILANSLVIAKKKHIDRSLGTLVPFGTGVDDTDEVPLTVLNRDELLNDLKQLDGEIEKLKAETKKT